MQQRCRGEGTHDQATPRAHTHDTQSTAQFIHEMSHKHPAPAPLLLLTATLFSFATRCCLLACHPLWPTALTALSTSSLRTSSSASASVPPRPTPPFSAAPRSTRLCTPSSTLCRGCGGSVLPAPPLHSKQPATVSAPAPLGPVAHRRRHHHRHHHRRRRRRRRRRYRPACGPAVAPAPAVQR